MNGVKYHVSVNVLPQGGHHPVHSVAQIVAAWVQPQLRRVDAFQTRDAKQMLHDSGVDGSAKPHEHGQPTIHEVGAVAGQVRGGQPDDGRHDDVTWR
jgi:hypothetical protein